jgi:hypothetical protein
VEGILYTLGGIMENKHYKFIADCPKCKKKVKFEINCKVDYWYTNDEWVVFDCECGMQFVVNYDEVNKYNMNPKKRVKKNFTKETLF